MPKVLLIDSDGNHLVPLQEALVTAGYEVSVALSGSFALTMLERDRPDLIVTLGEDQDMDAYELCSIIRADPATKEIPFLLVTGPAGPDPSAAARAGVSRVIAGNLNASTLVSQVQELLSRTAEPTLGSLPEAKPTGPSPVRS